MRDSIRCLRLGPRAPAARGRALAVAGLALALLGAAPDAPVTAGTPVTPATPAPAETDATRQDGPPRNDLDLSNDVLSNALATALQTVYERYVASASPIPASVRERLEYEYGPELSQARFVVSAAAVRLLGTIDRFQGTAFGKGMHALTIDDLILLASDPAESESPFTLWIWAHELHHVRQYRERGSIRAFARDYLRDCDAIERAADARANQALGMDVRVGHCLE